MAKQTHPIAHLVVVDNGPDEPAREVVEACGIPADLAAVVAQPGRGRRLRARDAARHRAGRGWIWLGDDDGRAADETVLATLVDVAQRRMLSAARRWSSTRHDPDRLAFTVAVGSPGTAPVAAGRRVPTASC